MDYEKIGSRLLELFSLAPAGSRVALNVVRGWSNREIADELYVTEKTVKFHLTNIYKKTDCKSRAMLIVMIMRLEEGTLPPSQKKNPRRL